MSNQGGSNGWEGSKTLVVFLAFIILGPPAGCGLCALAGLGAATVRSTPARMYLHEGDVCSNSDQCAGVYLCKNGHCSN